MPQITCAGCNRSFSYGAWSIHLAQTDNPPCRAIYNKRRAYLPGADSLPGANNAQDTTVPDDLIHDDQIFYGDFFGDDYNDDDFPGWADDGLQQPAAGSDSESDWDDIDPNLGWEAPAPDAPQHPLPAEDQEIDPMDDEHGRPMTQQERQQAAEGFQKKPFIVSYPSPCRKGQKYGSSKIWVRGVWRETWGQN